VHAVTPSTSIATPFLFVHAKLKWKPHPISSPLVLHAPASASTHTHTLSLSPAQPHLHLHTHTHTYTHSLLPGSCAANPPSLTSPLCTSSVPFGNADMHRTRTPSNSQVDQKSTFQQEDAPTKHITIPWHINTVLANHNQFTLHNNGYTAMGAESCIVKTHIHTAT